jgi:signal transduction histidine kinase
MKKLRLYFALFFVLLAIPIVVLLSHTYSNLEEESFFFYRRTAEGVMSTLHQQVEESLLDEEQRPYTHYRYIHVAEQPVPQQEGLNLSPLAGFPVQSDIPGILGYWQIDPDGSFNTPLLPEGNTEARVSVPYREEREGLRDQLASLLEGPLLSSPAGLREKIEAPKLDDIQSSRETTLSKLKKNLESNVDISLEEAYEAESSVGDSDYLSVLRRKDQDSVESVERRVQKASPTQAQVFDSQVKDPNSDQKESFADDLEQTRGNAAPERLDLLRNRVAGRQEDASNQVSGDRPREFQEVESDSASEVVTEVDPFQSELVDAEWLVFHRKVWSRDRRYIQGFAASLTEFLEAHLEPAFLNSALPSTASYLLFYQGEILETSGVTGDRRPLLLNSAALPYPLSDFHLAITVGQLPESPGYQVVNFLAIFLSLFFVGGLLGVYRLAATQLELSQKKSDFVSAVSHELKTPLTAIRMYGEMLAEGWVEEEKRARYYQHIHDESERLSRLIQNVLTLAELERKEWQIDFKTHQPVEFVKGVSERLNSQVKRAGFEISTVEEGEPKLIRADSDALTQILINLIDNAIKFSKDAESKKIVLTVSQLGSDCYIRVRDFGPGIERRKLKKIFEKFYRIDDEMTRTTRGTGIGLALVKSLADAMGAHVDVANRRPGTEFSLRFPTE